MERDKNVGPALKEWLDTVLVPILVRKYVAMCCTDGDNGISSMPSENSEDPKPERVQ
jgi:hypothetical protein